MKKDTPVEPDVGEQVTDRFGQVWQRFEDGWRWWVGAQAWLRSLTWDDVQTHFGPLRATTDDDRRRVGLPVSDEVAVNREDLRTALDAVWLHQSAPAVKREAVDRLRAALEADR